MGMEKYTEYDIQVSAFTYAGEGPKSSVVTERTSEDGKTCEVNVGMETRTNTMLRLGISQYPEKTADICDAMTGFPAKCRLRNQGRNSILMKGLLIG